jgi:hypothetical protein
MAELMIWGFPSNGMNKRLQQVIHGDIYRRDLRFYNQSKIDGNRGEEQV